MSRIVRNVRDRVKEVITVRASDVLPHPLNWRSHPEDQSDATVESLERFGQVAPLIVYQRSDGKFQLIDGHLRRDLMGDATVLVAVTDLSEEEAKALLAVYDPIGAMAGANAEALEQLLEEITVPPGALQDMLEELAREAGVSGSDGELKEVKVQQPPSMTWVLIGIPTVRFAEINSDIERLALLPGVLCEVTANSDSGPEQNPEAEAENVQR